MPVSVLLFFINNILRTSTNYFIYRPNETSAFYFLILLELIYFQGKENENYTAKKDCYNWQRNYVYDPSKEMR